MLVRTRYKLDKHMNGYTKDILKPYEERPGQDKGIMDKLEDNLGGR